MNVFQTEGPKGAVKAVEQALKDGAQRVLVSGPAMSGRTTVARDLAGNTVLEVLPPSAPDAVADVLLQVMALTGQGHPSGSFEERLRWMQTTLTARQKRVIVRLDAGWGNHWDNREEDGSGFRQHAWEWLQALTSSATKVPVVVVGHVPQLQAERHFKLSVPPVDWAGLEGASWTRDPYSVAAFSLRKRFDGRHLVPPIVARLAVGRIVLGEDLERVRVEVEALGANPTPHVQKLVAHVQSNEQLHSLLAPLGRLSRIRRPLPREAALGALGLSEKSDHIDLFLSCLGYVESTATVRWNEVVLRELRRALGAYEVGEDKQHLALADAWEQVDGVLDPNDANSVSAVRYWSEKVHHLARSGPSGHERWCRQVIRQPEQLWERARDCSLRGDFHGAANIYTECIKSDPQDDYAWHYLGFNREKAGLARGEVEAALKKAVELNPSNPWWNTRWVTWLIDQVRYREAESAWRQALEHVNPDGSGTDVWLVDKFYRHVVDAWLNAGELRRARAVYDVIPSEGRGAASDLLARLVDFEEAFELQGAVRPLGLVGADRWTPQVLPPKLDSGEPLRGWYGGRVEAVDEEGLYVRAATSGDPSERRVFVRKVTWAEWTAWDGSNQRTEHEGRFFELGLYGTDPTRMLARLLPRPEQVRFRR